MQDGCEWVRLAAAAERVGMPRSTFDEYVRAGLIDCRVLVLDGVRHFAVEDLDRLVALRT